MAVSKEGTMSALVECECQKCGQVWWIGQGQPRSGQRICPQCGIANQAVARDCESIPELEAEVRRLRGEVAQLRAAKAEREARDADDRFEWRTRDE
jgi:predicted  nucleic acid-binding Zn-ribbon protein